MINDLNRVIQHSRQRTHRGLATCLQQRQYALRWASTRYRLDNQSNQRRLRTIAVHRILHGVRIRTFSCRTLLQRHHTHAHKLRPQWRRLSVVHTRLGLVAG
eukprot:COSAG04_NODE_8949_length_913_cov_2.319410_2_plen_102_part_00